MTGLVKLFFCPACHDLLTLRYQRWRKCVCGKSAARYCDDKLNSEHAGLAVPLAIDTVAFAEMLENGKRRDELQLVRDIASDTCVLMRLPYNTPTIHRVDTPVDDLE